MNAPAIKRQKEESDNLCITVREKTRGLDCWVVPCGGGFPDVPSGSMLFYEPDGKVSCEGLYIVRENRPSGNMYVRILRHEVDKLRLVQTARGELYGEEIVIDVKDLDPKFACCGRVRVQISPFEPLAFAGVGIAEVANV